MSVVGELIGYQVPLGNNPVRVNIIVFYWKGETICALIILDTRANHLGRFFFVKDFHFFSHKFVGNTITRVFLSMCFKLR